MVPWFCSCPDLHPRDPVKVEVSGSFQTVDKLLQYYLFIPLKVRLQPVGLQDSR